MLEIFESSRDKHYFLSLVSSHKSFGEFDPSFPAQLCARARQLDASCQRTPRFAEQKNLGANSLKNFHGQVLGTRGSMQPQKELCSAFSETVKSIFYGLGSDWWKSIIDGQFHEFGEMVFDEGLHGYHVEPGYLNGISKASTYAVQVLSKENLSIPIYKRIHQLACSHFSGTEKSGTAKPEAAGAFREKTVITEVIWVSKWGADPTQVGAIAKFTRTRAICAILACVENGFGVDPSELLIVPRTFNQLYSPTWDKLGPTRDRVVEAYTKMSRSVKTLNEAANPFGAYFKKSNNGLSLTVEFIPGNIHKNVEDFFEAFNAKIKEADTEEKKLVLMADLFQKLEWTHAPLDGTRRTDLIVLNVLLAKYGFNPAILHDPVYATHHLLDEWVSYLKQGIEAWKIEKAKITPRS